MSDTKKYIQQNAVEVIEKFGGIRPMASKLGIAVTTIQGWKKRETIPEGRLDDIIRAANENKIVLGLPYRQSVPAEKKPEPPVESPPNIADAIAEIKARIEGHNPDFSANEEDLDIFSLDEEDDSIPIAQTTMKPITPTTSAPHTSQKIDVPKETILPSEKVEQPHIASPAEQQKASTANKNEAFVKPPEPTEKTTPPQQPVSKPAKKGTLAQWMMPMLLGASMAAIVILLWPAQETIKVNEERLDKLEQNLESLQQEQTTFIRTLGEFVPDDMKAQLEEFQRQTGELGQQVGDIAAQTSDMALSALGEENAAALQAKLTALQNQFGNLFAQANVDSIVSRFSTLSDTEEGQEQLERALSQLRGIVDSLDGRMDLLGEALVVARENSTALGDTFEGVSDKDLKAGALLLGLTQFRSSLNRDNTPFEEDLALLYSMVGEDDIELREALDKLAPQAESGVLTPTGLANEFRSLAGDIAISSLRGDDVSISDQAKSRLSKVLQIKKDGKPLLSDESQEKIIAVQDNLDAGDLNQAMSILSTLDKNADLPTSVAPFMQELEATVAAQNVSTAITSMLQEVTGSPSPINLKNLSANTAPILPQNSLKKDFKNLNVIPQE